MDSHFYKLIQRNPHLTRELHAWQRGLKELWVDAEQLLCDGVAVDPATVVDAAEVHYCSHHDTLHAVPQGADMDERLGQLRMTRLSAVPTIGMSTSDAAVLAEEFERHLTRTLTQLKAATLKTLKRLQPDANTGLLELGQLLTPSQQELYYVCRRKRAFAEITEARVAADELQQRQANENIEVYHCVHCGQHHIGHGVPMAPIVEVLPPFSQRFNRVWLRQPKLAYAYLAELGIS